MTQTETLSELATALSKAQGEIEGASKDSENPFFSSKYADLAAVWSAVREPFAKNGLSVHQGVRREFDESEQAVHTLVTRIMHSSGEWIEDGGVPLLMDKSNMQGLGSATTYARRYGLMAAAGICPEDDDGNAAVKGNGKNAINPEEPDWTGPLGKTAIKKAARDFVRALNAATNTGTIDSLVSAYNGMFKQLETDLPEWWNGNDESPGISEQINTRINFLQSRAP